MLISLAGSAPLLLGATKPHVAKQIATDATMVNGPEHAHFDSKEELETALKKVVKDGDKILVKGSRGMAMETIIDTLVN